MSENETGVKRSLEEDAMLAEEHKKQKLGREVTPEPTQTENKEDEPTVNETVINSTLQDTDTQAKENSIAETEKTNNTQVIDREMVSADLSKTVTQIPDTTKTPTLSEDASITSEQLLMALTSIQSTEAPAIGKVETPHIVGNEREESSSKEIADTVINAELNENSKEEPEKLETPEKEETTETMEIDVPDKVEEVKMEQEQTNKVGTEEIPVKIPSLAIGTDNKSDNPGPSTYLLSEKVTETKQQPYSSTLATALGISPKDAEPKDATLSSSAISTLASQSTTIKNASDSSSTGTSPLKLGNTIDTSANNLAATLSAAPNISISNLPDIKAALRRLSSANISTSSMIEQLSSSPRLPTIGQINERKGSMTDVSPSEILGNALAAVAATAARSTHPSNTTSSTAQPSTSSTNSTATAIGSLAAITANINNLIHSGRLHRNSFSQEDSHKNSITITGPYLGKKEERRKSSISPFSNAFGNILDQALIFGRKALSESIQTSQKTPRPKLIVKNEQVWKFVEGMEEIHLGYQLYSPHLILPNLENKVNGVMEIRVPARFLTFENIQVQKRAVWGTDIYTDDSDIVAMIIHSGKYEPKFVESMVDANDPFALAVAGKQKESTEAAKKLALSGKQYIHRYDHLIPDHDLKVTVRVLPKLQHYASSIRHKLKSRDWHQHDGMSLYVDKVEKMKRGDAKLTGRSSLKSNMFAYETYRKKALGMTVTAKSTVKETSSPTVHHGRVKKSSRVLRMFKIHSDLKKNTA